jgi:2-methylcitrate dehydratase PrpD
MSAVLDSHGTPRAAAGDQPLARRIARVAAATSLADLPAESAAKVKLCLIDFIGCAFEAAHLPWSRQAAQLAVRAADGATVIGESGAFAHADAAFANAVMGHGLVREDMHSGSISHLGIVVLPTLLALSQMRKVSGSDFIAAAVVGYEVGGQIGRAVMDAEIARIHRPTGVTGPVAAAAAGARLLGLDVDATTSALALAANTTLGFNQWAHTGGSEMFFHAGFAARNAMTAVRLAQLGAFASPSALDGEAGLFAALRKPTAGDKVELFKARPEIFAVYHKPVPACNFAQTPSQAALRIARERSGPSSRIASIAIRVPRAGALYPGCNSSGPFAHILQAKMSIQYNVATALMLGEISERNFALLDDAELKRLIGVTTLQVDDELTRAYPGLQGGEVEVRDADGKTHRARLDDVVNATAADVRARFRVAVGGAVGSARASEIETIVDGLEDATEAGQLASALRSPA